MTKLFKSTWLKLLIVPYILFTVLIFNYSSYLKTIPISFFDEMFWVGRSYFFEFYINRDFQNRIWQSYESYDQPKLTEYSYGAWLYPLYLKEKNKNEELFDYTRFLIKNGFYEIDESYMNNYTDYKRILNIVKLDKENSGFLEVPKEYVARYGTMISKPINLIYHARRLNMFLLAGAVIFAYFFILQLVGIPIALLFSTFYGFNSLIIDNGLKAHSEALFLFTFNAAFLFMSFYFAKGRKILYLLLFSLFAGLCMSTKLNGTMLVVIFFISNAILLFFSKQKRIEHILVGILPVVVGLVIFVSLNPFTFSNPIKNVQYMFDWRMKTATTQTARYKNSFLPNGVSRVKKIFNNFYYSKQVPFFNGIKIFGQLGKLKNYGNYLFIFFTLGLFYSLKLAFNKNITAIVIICSFITILIFMNYYLVLDWSRYYIHMSFFFIMFQSFGLYFLIKYVYKYLNLLAKRIINCAHKKERLKKNNNGLSIQK
jgi:hypothetical protein